MTQFIAYINSRGEMFSDIGYWNNRIHDKENPIFLDVATIDEFGKLLRTPKAIRFGPIERGDEIVCKDGTVEFTDTGKFIAIYQ